MGKLGGRIWVGSTLGLISFIAFSSQLYIVLPHYHHTLSSSLLKLLLPFNALVALVFYNYALCVFTNPGQVPKEWAPGLKQNQFEEVKKLTGRPRFCRSCRAYKPPRSHHCRKCDKCILRMDHHCPWLNNCVGFGNYGHFIRFLTAVDIACIYHLWMITSIAFDPYTYNRAPTTTEVALLILNYTTSVPTLIGVGFFTLYHYYCLGMNTTTIEGWEKEKVATLMRRGKIREFKYPYDLGPIANARTILGESVLWWCTPKKMRGDGLSFPVGKGIEHHTQYAWPPRDEFTQRQQSAAIERRAIRRAEGADQPFTYANGGREGLNPDLVPRSGSSRVAIDLIRRRNRGDEGEGMRGAELRRRKKSPYVQRSSDDESPHPSQIPPSSFRSPSSDPGDDDEEDEEDEEDDLPLGIAMRRALSKRLLPSSSVDAPSSASTTMMEATATIPRLPLDEIIPEPKVRLRRGSEGYEIRPIIPPRSHYQSGFEVERGDEVGNAGGGDDDGERGEREEWAPEGFYDSASDSSNDAFDPSTRDWSSDTPRLPLPSSSSHAPVRGYAGRGYAGRGGVGEGGGVGEENEGMDYDSEGDMVRRGDFGGRYRRYEKEVDSEGSEDSMEKYLKD